MRKHSDWQIEHVALAGDADPHDPGGLVGSCDHFHSAGACGSHEHTPPDDRITPPDDDFGHGVCGGTMVFNLERDRRGSTGHYEAGQAGRGAKREPFVGMRRRGERSKGGAAHRGGKTTPYCCTCRLHEPATAGWPALRSS
jgi:hypothetical protein